MMSKYSVHFLILSLFLLMAGLSAVCQTSPKPMQPSELLALVAGAGLPENVVHEIARRGLNFHPDQDYQAQLKRAGADKTVLTALLSAKVSADGGDRNQDKELLEHLTGAAVLMQDGHDNEAIEEISAALNSSFARPETGFVMGELLRRQEQWSQAALVYSEVLRV